MNLLQVIQEAVRDTGVNRIPQSAFGNPSEEIQRLVRAANKTGRALSQEHPWQILTREALFLFVAGENQGDIEAIAPGFSYILNDTLFNRTRRYPILSDTPQNWQMMKADSVGLNFEWVRYRIRGGQLLINPPVTFGVGDPILFEYIRRWWIKSSQQDRYLADTDVAVFDDELMILGTVWQYKKSEGFSNEAEFADYAQRFAQLASRDEPASRVSTSYTRRRSWAFSSFGSGAAGGVTPPVVPPVTPPGDGGPLPSEVVGMGEGTLAPDEGEGAGGPE